MLQRHYSQLKEELLKLKRPTEDGVADTATSSDSVLSDTACSTTENSNPTTEDNSAADVLFVSADKIQDVPSSVPPTSEAVNAAVDCDSVVTDSSSAAVV